MTNHQELLQRLREFIQSEFATQHANLERQWALPLVNELPMDMPLKG